MPKKLLLACDLDRTVLPNGVQPLSENAIPAFSEFVSRPAVTLAYMSGRHLGLIKDALKEFKIPLPDIAVGDVGTTMYFKKNNDFEVHDGWTKEISDDWQGFNGTDIHKLISDIKNLKLQETSKQNTFKQSYYTPVEIDKKDLIDEIQKRLKAKNIQAAVIFSIDEQANTGLLDILPASATKNFLACRRTKLYLQAIVVTTLNP
jgi:hydroxymethylpyrimidine pyrophosphatase-like HAD family hydrolase